MRIHEKLVLVEISIAMLLFLSLLFAINTLSNILQVEDLRNQATSLQDHMRYMYYTTRLLLNGTDKTEDLMDIYTDAAENFNREFTVVEEHKRFKNLSAEAQELFIGLHESWNRALGLLSTAEIVNTLDLRTEISEEFEGRSLGYVHTLTEFLGETEIDQTLLEELRDGIQRIEQLVVENEFFYERLEDSLSEFLVLSESYGQLHLFLTILVPVIMMLLTILFVMLFANDINSKLRILVGTMADITRGDFTIKMGIKSKDEFGHLFLSTNTIAQSLNKKLESFRTIMHEMSHSLKSGIDSALLKKNVVLLSLKDTVADGGALYMVSDESGELQIEVMEGFFRPPFPLEHAPEDPEELAALLWSTPLSSGSTILGEAAVRGEAKLIRDIQLQTELDWKRESGDPLYISSLIVLPLRMGDTVFGVLALTSNESGKLFSDLEFTTMQSFVELAAITIDNLEKYTHQLEISQLNRELDIAEKIQHSLLPEKPPPLPSGDIAFLSRGVKGLNGDYFDAYALGDDKTLITICEVAGRGIPAGLVMVMIQTVLRLVANPEKDAKTIITELNENMTHRIAIENYASISIFILNNNDGNFTFSSAAHYPIHILRAWNGDYEAIEIKGDPVGVDKNSQYQLFSSRLEMGDMVLLHTDGITDARNRDGKRFGIQPMLDHIKANAGNSPTSILETFRAELEYFERDTVRTDDQTAILLKFKGGSAA